MTTIVSILLILTALFMIVTVLLQSSDEGDGISALGAQSSNYMSKSKAKSFEAKLALGTKIAATAFVVLSIVMLVI